MDGNVNFYQTGPKPSSSGQQSLATVVLLHGLLGSAKNLGVLARALAGEYSVLSIDLRNHGRSPHSDEMTLSLLASDVCALLDTLSLRSVHLVGHSLGGKVAMTMALLCPERVDKLLVADIAPVTYPPQHLELFAALQQLSLADAGSRAELDVQLSESIQDAGVRQFLLQNIASGTHGFYWRCHLPAIIANYDHLRAGLSLAGIAEESAVESLRIVGTPYAGDVLFLGGERSEYIKEAYAAHSQKLFPNYAFRQVAGAGHWLHADQPQRTNREVLRFLHGSSGASE